METVAALSTPVGYGGIAVIRVSGGEALGVADSLFSGVSRKELPSAWAGYSCGYGRVVYSGETLDDCILTVYKAPRSYTGEDVVEISCHGGVLAAERILRAIYDLGVRPAEAGEFTERAFFSGKMSLTQAEAVMDIISARGAAELRSALAVRDGAIAEKIRAAAEALTFLLAELGVWADYPDDDDIADISTDKILSVIGGVTKTLHSLTDHFRVGKLLKAGIPLCIAGKPNVGKSSIMNMLAGEARSIVTDIPGTTRDVIENEITVGDLTFRVFDTAGIHETADEIERQGTELAKAKIRTAEIILAVFDASSEADERDDEIIRLTAGKNAIALLNKCDKPHKINSEYIRKHYETVISISAKSGEGRNDLAAAITSAPGLGAFSGAEIILNDRQYAAAASALERLREAELAANSGAGFDAITILLDNALAKLSELTGESVEAAVARSIFKNFCVGK
jgi:tRNA modification GTPase